jgi:hypothetical protein
MLATRDSHRPPALETYHPNIHDRPRKHAKDEENDPYEGGGKYNPPSPPHTEIFLLKTLQKDYIVYLTTRKKKTSSGREEKDL